MQMKLQFIGVRSKILKIGESVFDAFCEGLDQGKERLDQHDIICISSKIVALEQGRVIFLEKVPVHPQAFQLAKHTGLDEHFTSLIISEAETIIGGVSGAFLTLREGILEANAGIDRSNAQPGCAILLPDNPQQSAMQFRKRCLDELGVDVGVIIQDSSTRPLRRGTVGICLAASGFPAVVDDRGTPDLFGKKMLITTRAIADNITCGANLVMGETNQQTPFVIVRGVPYDEWIPRAMDNKDMFIPFDQCLYFKHFSGKKLFSKAESS